MLTVICMYVYVTKSAVKTILLEVNDNNEDTGCVDNITY